MNNARLKITNFCIAMITFFLLFFLSIKTHSFHKKGENEDFHFNVFYSKKLNQLHITVFNGKTSSVIIKSVCINKNHKHTQKQIAHAYHKKYFQFGMLQKGKTHIIISYRFKFGPKSFYKIAKMSFTIK